MTDYIETKTDTNEGDKVDYLTVDDCIPGQNYVCLSFLSPESLIQDKEGFKCAKFLQSYCKDKNLKFDDVYNSYVDFNYKYEDKIQRDFDEKNNFQTSLRGIKVRGVFDTKDAAQERAKKLSTQGSSFHTFVGQVGYWLPWDPNADKVADEVFQNSQLNDMMEKYEENNINRDIFYEEQKREKIRAAAEEKLEKERENQAKLAQEKLAQEKASAIEECPGYENIENDSPSPTCKPDLDLVMEGELNDSPEEVKMESPEDEQNIGFSPTTSKSPLLEVDKVDDKVESTSNVPTDSVSQVSDDIKSALEGSDPWMQQKGSQTN